MRELIAAGFSRIVDRIQNSINKFVQKWLNRSTQPLNDQRSATPPTERIRSASVESRAKLLLLTHYILPNNR
jgi:hypothetical protein